MKKTRIATYLLVGLLALLGLVGCSNATSSNNDSKNESSDKPVSGGTLNIAFGSDPDTIDWMYTGATATRDIGWHIFEGLFALDKDFKIKPMLADDYTISEDKKTYTIKLRDGLTFHDGNDVTSEDVVESINRWQTVSSVGKIASGHIESVKATDDLTIVVQLKDVYNSLLADFAAPKSSLIIIPAEIAKSAGEQPLGTDQLIGTGPYKFESWDRGNQIVLTKNENYSAREETDWGGLTGKKTAYFDKLNFKIVKDSQVMVNGLKTGIYDYAQSIPLDLYDVIEATDNIDPVTYDNGYSVITPDKSEAPFDDISVRQALHYALDKETIAKATYGNKDFFNLDGALFAPNQTELYSDKGTENYISYNQEEAEKLLEESDYDGKPITIMFSNDNTDYQKIAEIAKQQLEAVGFSVKLESYEWATYLEKWADPANWDLVVVGWSTRFSPNELGMLSVDTSSSGWYKSDRWTDLIAQWGDAETTEQKQQVLADMNKTVYEELPFEKITNISSLDIKTSKLKDYDSWVGQRFWNTWKDK